MEVYIKKLICVVLVVLIIFISACASNNAGVHEDFVAETETGDIVNYAIYRRNMAIEERYNLKIDFDFDDT